MAQSSMSYDVRVWGIDKADGKRGATYRLRWVVAGRTFSARFVTAALADSRRSELLLATRRGEGFDVVTGLPRSLWPDERSLSWWQWTLQYVDLKWPTLAPTSRRSTAEALSNATMALVLPASKRRISDSLLRSSMTRWAYNLPARSAGPPNGALAEAAEWLAANTLPLREIEDAATARMLLDSITRTQRGGVAAPTTIARKRAVIYNVLELAVEHEHFTANPLDRIRWNPPKVTGTVDPRSVVNPKQARVLLEAVAAQGARGTRLTAFFGCMYYAALRPSEALALRLQDVQLPDADGWGQLLVSRSDAEVSSSWTDEGRRATRQLKHRARGSVRIVPSPPPLTKLLKQHLVDFPPGASGRLFLGPYGGTVTAETYMAVWTKARIVALTPAEASSSLARRPYDLRHAAVSTWLAAGVESSQVAAWAGHSVAVMHRTYAHVLTGREATARSRVEEILTLGE